jgi:hypothetical protein
MFAEAMKFRPSFLCPHCYFYVSQTFAMPPGGSRGGVGEGGGETGGVAVLPPCFLPLHGR